VSKNLEGKVALITGGSRGIGAAIAKRLASDGANVAITYTKAADAAALVVKEIERAGRKAIAIQADAADADAVEAAVEKTVATFGKIRRSCQEGAEQDRASRVDGSLLPCQPRSQEDRES
jgi:3-oxoacyl-[acyl-carrier protein] reductase